MSLRNRLVVPVIFSALALLAGCGSSSNPTVTPPPSGGFTKSNLNGTYVFSVSGTDQGGFPYAMVGTLTADGSGGIKSGAVDLNDDQLSAGVPNATISGGGYTVGADGRGTATLSTNTPFSTIELDFVLQDSSHGLVTEFDANASGSGTLDIQTAGTTPNGSYAFSLFGNGGFATVGNFTVGSGGAITGLEDFNNGGSVNTDETLSGQLIVGPSSTPSTNLLTSSFGLTFDVYAIDATHLKFIEMDAGSALEGDAYSQTSTSMPVGTLPFTLGGDLTGGVAFVAGGFMVTDGSGDITNASSEDFNANGTTVSSAPVTFSGSYSAAGTGRYVLNNFSGFEGVSQPQFVAYPSSAGVFLLEIDSSLGIMSGIAYPAQSSTTFASGQGYGMNLQGVIPNVAEVDDIAEFTAGSDGSVTGFLDENYAPGGAVNPNVSLSGTTFTAATGGRGQIGTGTNGINTLVGGFVLTYYTVDGTTVPFVEVDSSGQVSSGVMVEQNASASAAELVKAGVKHLYVPPRITKSKKTQQKQK